MSTFPYDLILKGKEKDNGEKVYTKDNRERNISLSLLKLPHYEFQDAILLCI